MHTHKNAQVQARLIPFWMWKKLSERTSKALLLKKGFHLCGSTFNVLYPGVAQRFLRKLKQSHSNGVWESWREVAEKQLRCQLVDLQPHEKEGIQQRKRETDQSTCNRVGSTEWETLQDRRTDHAQLTGEHATLKHFYPTLGSIYVKELTAAINITNKAKENMDGAITHKHLKGPVASEARSPLEKDCLCPMTCSSETRPTACLRKDFLILNAAMEMALSSLDTHWISFNVGTYCTEGVLQVHKHLPWE